MPINKKFKKTIWMYAVILFTSAFILLIFTYYSQNKYDKNIEDYLSRLTIEEKKKLSFQTNLTSAYEENEKLKKEINSVKSELNKLNNFLETKDSELKNLKGRYAQTLASYEAMVEAENEYKKGNTTNSAMILFKQCDSSLLSNWALERYHALKLKTYKSAAQELYKQGYSNYKNKKYQEAIEKIQMSLALVHDEYYSDDGYYYLGYSNYRLGNNEQAVSALEVILKEYPKSNCYEDAKVLLSIINK